ncbi:MAG TPA: hypothetical protein PKA37_01795 [Planctomycetota bacterium]|jgi:G3E family GTPase|nr:hypothetical protein [Planctomycetota bacterium]
MAEDEFLDDDVILTTEEDNAKALTTGLVCCTTAGLVLAFIMMQLAMAKWFQVGLFAGN